MTLEVGKVYSGKVDKITDYGAFIKLDNGGSGLCHISEVADGFVKTVSDKLALNQVVKVKVISINGNKVNLSIKKATESSGQDRQPARERAKERPQSNKSFGKDKKPFRERKPSGDNRNYSKPNSSGGGFEDMLTSFIKTSDDKQHTGKKSSKSSRKGNGYNR